MVFCPLYGHRVLLEKRRGPIRPGTDADTLIKLAGVH